MKIELLSPAGSMESLKAAIHNGADAVYLGGKKFGARAFAQNFTKEELVEAINYAHTYNTKIYITVNTLIYDDEFIDALDFIEFLYTNNVDAIIMQDIGLMYEAHRRFPELTIHASTQCHNHNKENIEFMKSIGVKRVILDREMTLDEIKQLGNELEIEIFIHGALCISYSGCCLMSYLNGGRSGNRGECTGCCRLPYKLIKENKEYRTNGKYLISTKELNTSHRINELKNTNIVSLKIEGRMKSPEYVGFITKYYRNILDNKPINKEDEKKLKLLFNRDFTEGYLFNEQNITNINTSNHQGIQIGQIIKIDNKFIKIKLNEDLNQEDGIRFENNKGMIVNKLYNQNKLLVSSVSKNNIAYIENKCNIKQLGQIRKTTDIKLIKELKNFEQKKLDITFTVEAKLNKALKIFINEGNINIEQKGNIIQKSITNETTKEQIVKQLSKLGNTPFKAKNIIIEKDDNIFINMTELNTIRRSLVQQLINAKTIHKPKVINKIVDNPINYKDNTLTISISVHTEEQYKGAKEEKINTIYTDNYILHKKHPETFYKLPRVLINKPIINNDNLLITEIGSISYTKNNNVYGSYELNALNNHTLQVLHNNGIKQITISPEINDKINLIDNKNNNIEIIVYGWIEAMIMKHCIIKNLTNSHDCSKNYYLQNQNKELFPITQNNCLTTILNSKPLNNIDKIKYYKSLNINHFRIDLFNENYNETIKIIKSIKNNII